jgi:hypothetical protein
MHAGTVYAVNLLGSFGAEPPKEVSGAKATTVQTHNCFQLVLDYFE